jgi:hypothetical protein
MSAAINDLRLLRKHFGELQDLGPFFGLHDAVESYRQTQGFFI